MLRRRLIAGLLLCTGLAHAQEKADPNGVLKKPAPPTGTPMTLAECLSLAEQRQPKLKAAYHSLRAAELGLQGLNSLGRFFDRLSPDLPVRRLQAELGLRVAQAEVEKVRQETVYDVQFNYFTHVYTRQAEQTAADVLASLETYANVVEELLDKPGAKDLGIEKPQYYNLQVIIGEVQGLRLEAETKRRQTLVALRYAMGVGPECDLYPLTEKLPMMDADGRGLTEAQVVQWALACRPEIAQATTAQEVFTLEACAQSKIRHRPQVNTLAAGTDLHSRPVPLPLRNGQWRPGALAPEMPTSLVGGRDERVARAAAYGDRQSAQTEDTVALVRLDAENAFIEWSAAVERLRLTKRKFDLGRQSLEYARSVATTTKGGPALVGTSEAVAGRAQADYVRAVYDHLMALVKLQRVTAGQVQLHFTAGGK